jgi:hypothetical protein
VVAQILHSSVGFSGCGTRAGQGPRKIVARTRDESMAKGPPLFRRTGWPVTMRVRGLAPVFPGAML